MAKKVKKKIKFKIIPMLLLLITLVVLYFAFSYLIDTKIKNIYIYGNNLLTDQEIIELAKIEDYPSFYKTFSTTIKKNIMTNPVIKEVNVRKGFFNVLRIYVTEYKPIFIKGDKLILDNGTSTDLISTKVAVLSNEVDSDIYKDLIKAMSELKDSVRSQISEVIYSKSEYDNSRFLLYMDDGNHVYVNISKFSKLNYYDEIYPTLNGKKGTLYLDSGNHFEVF